MVAPADATLAAYDSKVEGNVIFTKLDAAIKARQELEEFLKQDAHAKSSREETLARLEQLAALLAP